jgi:hypothetical protein
MYVLTKIVSILPRPAAKANNTLATSQNNKINKSHDGECQLNVRINNCISLISAFFYIIPYINSLPVHSFIICSSYDACIINEFLNLGIQKGNSMLFNDDNRNKPGSQSSLMEDDQRKDQGGSQSS